MKIKWKVSPAPEGQYRSFARRSWPMASYVPTGQPAAQVCCVDDYNPRLARTGLHPLLTVLVADYSTGATGKPPWQWRKMKGTFAMLAEAKAAVARLLEKNPQISPSNP